MTQPILKSLHTAPNGSDRYLWCDYIELRCLTSIDKRFSRQNLIEVIDDSKAAGINTASAKEDYVEDDDDGEDEEIEVNFEQTSSASSVADDDSLVEEVLDAHGASALLPSSDRNEATATDLYENLRLRASWFGDAYPFALDPAAQEIRLKDGDRSAAEILYLQLLLSSSLRLVPQKRRHELTDAFEELATEIFRGLMPPIWEVHQFGAASSTRYKGHLWDRLNALAKDWRGEHKLEKDDYKTTNSGDGGLDIVAWHPMGDDEREGIPLAAAQCGCAAEEWQLKQLEASPAALGSKIETLSTWATYYFMPLDLIKHRDGKKVWQRRDKILSSIVIDRYRILKLADQMSMVDRYATPSAAVAEASAMTEAA